MEGVRIREFGATCLVPIQLSYSLSLAKDSEMGVLSIVTDILLRSWSENTWARKVLGFPLLPVAL